MTVNLMNLVPTICAICGADRSTQLYPANFSTKDLNPQTFSARRIPDRIHYRLVRCKKCGLVYSNPILASNLLTKLYEKSVVTYEKQVEDLCKTYWRYFMMTSTIRGVASQHLGGGRTDSSEVKILEIGCGDGFFLEYLKQCGWTNVLGVEPSRAASLKAPRSLRKRIINSILRPNLFTKESFDYICTFQTLDHVIDPNQFLQICWQLLKPGGKMLAINHDADSWSAKLLGEKSPIIDIEHIYLFNKPTLAAIFAKNGFTVEKVFTVIDQHRLDYWLRMLPLPKVIKDSLTITLTVTKLSKIPLRIPAGNIGIVARKK